MWVVVKWAEKDVWHFLEYQNAIAHKKKNEERREERKRRKRREEKMEVKEKGKEKEGEGERVDGLKDEVRRGLKLTLNDRKKDERRRRR